MPRAKTVVPGLARRKKVMKKARGYRGGRGRLFQSAAEAVMRAGRYAYRDRRARKREFRRLWITRINAAARANGLTYSTLMNGLRRAHIDIDRKMLSDLAVKDENAFARLAQVAREASA
jgi:large subunit ribosomal protein L20